MSLNDMRQLRRVFPEHIAPGTNINSVGNILTPISVNNKTVRSWNALSEESFRLDGYLCDHVLVEFEDNSEEHMILVRGVA